MVLWIWLYKTLQFYHVKPVEVTWIFCPVQPEKGSRSVINQEINCYEQYKIQLCNNVTPKDNNLCIRVLQENPDLNQIYVNNGQYSN
jgi:hypothetical protein